MPISHTRAVIQASAAPIPDLTIGAKLRTVEALLGSGGLAVGLWVLCPFWATFESTPTYAPLTADHIPEMAWGVVFTALGLLRLGALLWGGTKAKVAGAIGISLMWGLLLIVSTMGNPSGLGPPLFGVLTGYSLVSLYRIAGRR